MCLLDPRLSGSVYGRTMLSALESIWEQGLKSPLPSSYCMKWVSLPDHHLPICKNVGCYLSQTDILQFCLWNLVTVWDKIGWMQFYPLHLSDNNLGFFLLNYSYWAEQLCQGPCVAWKPYFWAVFSPGHTLNFSLTMHFWLVWWDFFLFLSCMSWSKNFCAWLCLVLSHSTELWTSYL